jgi:integrase
MIKESRGGMGHSRKRHGRDGRPRYTAYYNDKRGDRRSAGTFTRKEDSEAAWQKEQARVHEGRSIDLKKGQQEFDIYVQQTWLPNHVMEATTREGYTYSIDKHIMPFFGPMKMIFITSEEVREWVTWMGARGVSPATVQKNKMMLSAIFSTAVTDGVVYFHPCYNVNTPTVPTRPKKIITPEQFDTFYEALRHEVFKLMAETSIGTGLRYGELTELRPDDIDRDTRILTVSRAVVQVHPKFHPTGGRFLVKRYPKDEDWRRFKISHDLCDKLFDRVDGLGLGPQDLIFAMPNWSLSPAPASLPPLDELGQTAPNDKGRTYRHGTLSGYSAGRCKCEHCRRAYAEYRAKRRSDGKDNPRQQRRAVYVDSDGHIPNDWFRHNVWVPAIKSAGLRIRITPKGLRDAHASWLLAGGADLEIVRERLGHKHIATTQKYLGTLDDCDETALEALSRTRNRKRSA